MYGYRIENGIAVIDEQEAAVIIGIFNGYLSGMSLTAAAENAGKPMVHSRVKNIIKRTCYVGDDFYPAIVSKQTFARANAELIRRANKHCRGSKRKTPPIFKEFTLSVPAMQFEDPIRQAEYIYSLIEVRK
ncbi:MAG: recombinase [Ruminococcus sp.]|nr:recombinase [Ruminococcus sp.]